MSERERPRVDIEPTRCPYCHDAIVRGEKPEVCPSCHALHHKECWGEHGGCSACGAETVKPPAPVANAAKGSAEPKLCKISTCKEPVFERSHCLRHEKLYAVTWLAISGALLAIFLLLAITSSLEKPEEHVWWVGVTAVVFVASAGARLDIARKERKRRQGKS